MKPQLKDNKVSIKTEDDSLFGLLSIYKKYGTYFRILINNDIDNLILQITNNPKKWPKLTDEKFVGYRLLKRSEINNNKLFVKYLLPEYLIDQIGPLLGLKLSENETQIYNNLDTGGFYSIEMKSKYLSELIAAVDKIIDLSPQKKYEFIEKNISKNI